MQCGCASRGIGKVCRNVRVTQARILRVRIQHGQAHAKGSSGGLRKGAYGVRSYDEASGC